MPLLRPIILIHFFSSIILTVTIKILWNSSFNDNDKTYFTSICSPFTGCRNNNHDTKNTHCKNMKISCAGSKRCCSDCFELQSIHLKSQLQSFNIDSFTSNITVQKNNFSNEFSLPITISITTATIIFFLQIILLILLKMQQYYIRENVAVAETTPTPTNQSKSIQNKQLFLKICSSVCIIITFFHIILSVSYTFGYIVIHLDILLKCQPVFIILFSWTIIHVIFFLEFFNDIIPKSHKLKGKNLLYMCLKLCFYPLSLLSQIFYMCCLLWWIFVTIYLIGVAYDKWKF